MRSLLGRLCGASCLVVLAGCSAEKLAADYERLEQEVAELRQGAQQAEKEIQAATAKIDKLEKGLQDAKSSFSEFRKKMSDEIDSIRARPQASAEKFESLPAAARMKVKIPFDIHGSLEEAAAQLSAFTTVPLRIESDDLSAAGVPKIRQVELDRGKTAETLLAQALRQANPTPVDSLADKRQVLVYVLHPAADGTEEIVLTTREKAPLRGALPEVFEVK